MIHLAWKNNLHTCVLQVLWWQFIEQGKNLRSVAEQGIWIWSSRAGALNYLALWTTWMVQGPSVGWMGPSVSQIVCWKIGPWEPSTAPCALGLGPRGPALPPPMSYTLGLGLRGVVPPPPTSSYTRIGLWCLVPPHPALCPGIRHWIQQARPGTPLESKDLAVGKQFHHSPTTKFPNLWGTLQAGWHGTNGQRLCTSALVNKEPSFQRCNMIPQHPWRQWHTGQCQWLCCWWYSGSQSGNAATSVFLPSSLGFVLRNGAPDSHTLHYSTGSFHAYFSKTWSLVSIKSTSHNFCLGKFSVQCIGGMHPEFFTIITLTP